MSTKACAETIDSRLSAPTILHHYLTSTCWSERLGVVAGRRLWHWATPPSLRTQSIDIHQSSDSGHQGTTVPASTVPRRPCEDRRSGDEETLHTCLGDWPHHAGERHALLLQPLGTDYAVRRGTWSGGRTHAPGGELLHHPHGHNAWTSTNHQTAGIKALCSRGQSYNVNHVRNGGLGWRDATYMSWWLASPCRRTSRTPAANAGNRICCSERDLDCWQVADFGSELLHLPYGCNDRHPPTTNQTSIKTILFPCSIVQHQPCEEGGLAVKRRYILVLVTGVQPHHIGIVLVDRVGYGGLAMKRGYIPVLLTGVQLHHVGERHALLLPPLATEGAPKDRALLAILRLAGVPVPWTRPSLSSADWVRHSEHRLPNEKRHQLILGFDLRQSFAQRSIMNARVGVSKAGGDHMLTMSSRLAVLNMK